MLAQIGQDLFNSEKEESDKRDLKGVYIDLSEQTVQVRHVLVLPGAA